MDLTFTDWTGSTRAVSGFGGVLRATSTGLFYDSALGDFAISFLSLVDPATETYAGALLAGRQGVLAGHRYGYSWDFQQDLQVNGFDNVSYANITGSLQLGTTTPRPVTPPPVTPVPLPASFPLLAAVVAGFGLLGLRRRRLAD